MKRRLLPLLLAACCAQAHARDPELCRFAPSQHDPQAVERANERVAAAREAPGEQQLVLADTDAQAALAIVKATPAGMRTLAKNEDRVTALVAEAADIWLHARPTAALAAHVHGVGSGMLAEHRCALALPVLQAALTIADRAEGPDSAHAQAILWDTLRTAAAQGKDDVAGALAPRWVALIEKRTRAFSDGETEVAFDLLRATVNLDQLAEAERLAQRALALLPRDAARSAEFARRIKLHLASVYYAQLRFAEGEALRESLHIDGAAYRSPAFATFHRERDALIAQVRKGDLAGAYANARTLEDSYQRRVDSARAALAAWRASDKPVPQEQMRSVRADAEILPLFLARAQGYVGEILHAQGKFDAAAAAYERALANHGERGSLDQSDTYTLRSDLALVEHARGNLTQAIELQELVLSQQAPLYGPQHPDVLLTQGELAVLYRKTGNDDAARGFYQQHLDGARAARRPAPEWQDDLAALAEIDAARKEYASAIGFQEAYVAALGQGAKQGAGQELRRRAGRRLAELYRLGGQPDKARDADSAERSHGP